jgi:hypothetical protein
MVICNSPEGTAPGTGIFAGGQADNSWKNRRQRFRSPVNVEPLCSNVRLVASPFVTWNV